MNNLKQMRKQLGVSGREMAELMDVSFTTIYAWESNPKAVKYRIAAYKLLCIEKLLSDMQYIAQLKQMDSTKSFGYALERIIREGE